MRRISRVVGPAAFAVSLSGGAACHTELAQPPVTGARGAPPDAARGANTGQSAPVSRQPATAPLDLHVGTREAATVTVEGHPVRVWRMRAASPRAVVLLVHGRTWSSVPDWDLQRREGVAGRSPSLMRALADEGITTYAIDLRGYGETPRDDTGWLTPDRAAADLLAVAAWVCEDASSGGAQGPASAGCMPSARPVALGWSMGALVTQLAAQREPQRFSAVILYGYPGGPDKPAKVDPAPEAPPRRTTTRAAARSDFRVEGVDADVVDAYVDACLRADPVMVDWKGGEQWASLAPEALALPVLLLWGASDPIASDRGMEAFARRAKPGLVRSVRLADADHAAHLEHAGPRFVDAVVEFAVGAVPSRSPG